MAIFPPVISLGSIWTARGYEGLKNKISVDFDMYLQNVSEKADISVSRSYLLMLLSSSVAGPKPT